MLDQVFTIGHSNHSMGKFVELLRTHAIELVCDVRSTPYSRFNPQFNREPLQAELKQQGIGYLYLGRELGGKPSGADVPADDTARFAMIAQSKGFGAGLDRLLREAKSSRVAIMCAEKDPARCHRTHLICRHLPPGVLIHHILADGSLLNQSDVDPKAGGESSGQQSLL
jgi:uncharacterized protein (DUF488 family)